MSIETFQRIIQESKKIKRIDVVVLYHGGEPFINKNIFEMIRILKFREKIPFVTLNTNGMLITEEQLLKIIESGLDEIEFSLDGLNPKENNWIRCGSDYHQIASIIKQLLTMKINLDSKTPEVYIANIQIPTEKAIKAKVEASAPEYILNDFAHFKKRIKFKLAYMCKWPGFIPSHHFKLIKTQTTDDDLPNYCDHIMQTVTFMWNGIVVPCCYDIMGSYPVGNILQQSLPAIWNSLKLRQLRESIYSHKFLPLCSKCCVINPYTRFVTK